MWELFRYHVGTHAIHMVSMVSWGNFFDTMWEHFWYLWCPWCHVGTYLIPCGNISDTYGVMWELLLYLWCPRWSPNKIKISFKQKLKVLLNLLSVIEWYCDLFSNVGTFSKLMVSSRYSAPVVLNRFSLWDIFHYSVVDTIKFPHLVPTLEKKVPTFVTQFPTSLLKFPHDTQNTPSDTQVPTYGQVPTLRTPCGNFFFSTLRLKSFLKKKFLIEKSAMSKKFSEKSTTRKFQTWKILEKSWRTCVIGAFNVFYH